MGNLDYAAHQSEHLAPRGCEHSGRIGLGKLFGKFHRRRGRRKVAGSMTPHMVEEDRRKRVGHLGKTLGYGIRTRRAETFGGGIVSGGRVGRLGLIGGRTQREGARKGRCRDYEPDMFHIQI